MHLKVRIAILNNEKKMLMCIYIYQIKLFYYLPKMILIGILFPFLNSLSMYIPTVE